MAWAAIIFLAAAEGCWGSLNPPTYGTSSIGSNLYGNQYGQYASAYGNLRWPWYGLSLGSSCGPCSFQPPCQCLQPQAPSDGNTGLNSLEVDPPPITTTSTTAAPPPQPEKRQPSMPEYIPPPPKPFCQQPIQGCSCIPGLLSVACLPLCMKVLLGSQAVNTQYNPGQTGGQYTYPGNMPQYTGSQNGNHQQQQQQHPSQTWNQPLYSGSQPGAQQAVYSGQTLNQQIYAGSQTVGQPAIYPAQTLNQPLYTGGQNLNQPTLYSSQYPGGQSVIQPYGQTLAQQMGYSVQNLNPLTLYSSQSGNPWLYDNQNLAVYGAPAQEDGFLSTSTFGQKVFGTKRSLGQPSQHEARKSSYKKLEKY